MTKKKSVSKARKHDQFYTPSAIALACIQATLKLFPKCYFDRFIEPSAGTGAYYNQLGPNCVAIDLDPKVAGIIKADFLSWCAPEEDKKTLVIGNPPFGKNASLVVKFFNHAAKFADAISFIVPKSCRKASLQNRFDRRFHLLHEMELPSEKFLHEGKEVYVPCVFQVWQRRDTLRELVKKPLKHPDFTFCARQDAEFAVQRIGANAGRIKDVTDHISDSSHFFIRADDPSQDLRAIFEAIDFTPAHETSGPVPSVAKTELVALYAATKKASEEAEDTQPAKESPEARQPTPAQPTCNHGIQTPDVWAEGRLRGDLCVTEAAIPESAQTQRPALFCGETGRPVGRRPKAGERGLSRSPWRRPIDKPEPFLRQASEAPPCPIIDRRSEDAQSSGDADPSVISNIRESSGYFPTERTPRHRVARAESDDGPRLRHSHQGRGPPQYPGLGRSVLVTHRHT